MNPGVRLQQLYILRAQVDMLIAMEEGLVLPDEPVSPECPHPEDKRVPSNNMGEEPQFWCQDCKQFVKGAA